MRSRNQEIAYVLNKFPDMISLEQTVISVRTLGDVALVNGTYVLQRRVNGHPVEEKGVFSHVFQRNSLELAVHQRAADDCGGGGSSEDEDGERQDEQRRVAVPYPARSTRERTRLLRRKHSTQTNSAAETQPTNPQQRDELR